LAKHYTTGDKRQVSYQVTNLVPQIFFIQNSAMKSTRYSTIDHNGHMPTRLFNTDQWANSYGNLSTKRWTQTKKCHHAKADVNPTLKQHCFITLRIQRITINLNSKIRKDFMTSNTTVLNHFLLRYVINVNHQIHVSMSCSKLIHLWIQKYGGVI